MIINGKDIDINDLVDEKELDNNFHKKVNNNLYLSDYQISVLERNGINYKEYSSMKELSFALEEILNDEVIDQELEEVSRQIDEYRYYNEIHH